MNSKLALPAVLAGTGLLALAGCGQPPAPPPPPPPQVEVARPDQRDVTVWQEFTGYTRATEQVEVRARVQGFLESMEFTPSTWVSEGDLLFTIERQQYEANRDQARADLETAEAYLRRAESDLERLEQAVKTNAVSQQDVTRATAERDQARGAVLAARAGLERAEIDLEYTRIDAPISGLVSRQLVDPGNLVGRSDPTLLARVYNVDPIHVYFEVNERLLLAMLEEVGGMTGRQAGEKRADTPVQVRAEGSERVFEGRVDYLDPATDPETGTAQVRALVPNEDRLLLPGFFVRIRFPGRELPDALLVPEAALSTDLGGRYLMLVDGQGHAEKRYVEPGPLQEGQMRVILDGLEAEERFILKGLQRARPGMPVQVVGG